MLDDAWGAVSELGAAQHGVFTRAQASSAGLDARRLLTGIRQGRVRQTAPSVFVFEATVHNVRQRLMAATLAGCRSFASHRSSAHLLRFDGFDRPDHLPVEVSALSTQRWPPMAGVLVHRAKDLPKSDLVVVDGIPCMGVARTLSDLCSVVDGDAVLKALIGLRAKGTSLRWLRETAERLDRPRASTKVLLAHLDQWQRAGAVPESWLEEVLRRILEHPSLPALASQYELRDAAGRLVARFYHAFPDVRLAIEGHSRQFHFGPVAEAADEDRDLRAARQGWEITYLGWYSQRCPADVVAAIAEIVSHRMRPAA